MSQELRCHDSLLQVLDAETNDQGRTQKRYRVDLDKLGGAVLITDPDIEDIRAYEEELIFKSMEEEFIFSPFVPVFDYDKEKHGSAKLVTLSNDPEVEYPDYLHINSMHRFSPSKQGNMPPLKGVKKLRISEVSNSLDFNTTGVKHVVIDRVDLSGKPESLSDYDIIWPCSYFAVAYRNPPCIIKCETVEVKYFNLDTDDDDDDDDNDKDCNQSRSRCLHYDCDTFIVTGNAAGNFSSSCTTLVLRPDFKLREGDSFTFDVPNVKQVLIRTN